MSRIVYHVMRLEMFWRKSWWMWSIKLVWTSTSALIMLMLKGWFLSFLDLDHVKLQFSWRYNMLLKPYSFTQGICANVWELMHFLRWKGNYIIMLLLLPQRLRALWDSLFWWDGYCTMTLSKFCVREHQERQQKGNGHLMQPITCAHRLLLLICFFGG